MTGYSCGFSDHSLGITLPLAAVAMGACVIEKHVTTDRSLSGPDHHFALTFEEFGKMTMGIRDVEIALGSGKRDVLLPEEEELRMGASQSVCMSRYFSRRKTFCERCKVSAVDHRWNTKGRKRPNF